MHTHSVAESDGTFTENRKTDVWCPKCKQTCTTVVKLWESDCGGYEDEKFSCTHCGHTWWVDGPDA